MKGRFTSPNRTQADIKRFSVLSYEIQKGRTKDLVGKPKKDDDIEKDEFDLSLKTEAILKSIKSLTITK